MMREFMPGICALNATRARNYPDFPNDSYFKILNVVSIQLNAPGTIRFESHFLILRPPLRIKSSIILRDHFSKGIGITIKQGFSESLKCQQELFF